MFELSGRVCAQPAQAAAGGLAAGQLGSAAAGHCVPRTASLRVQTSG